MTCKKANPVEAGIRKRRTIARLFDEGKVKYARTHRWLTCVQVSGCGMACIHLDKEAGQKPTCQGIDLYDALKRREFVCPDGCF